MVCLGKAVEGEDMAVHQLYYYMMVVRMLNQGKELDVECKMMTVERLLAEGNPDVVE